MSDTYDVHEAMEWFAEEREKLEMTLKAILLEAGGEVRVTHASMMSDQLNRFKMIDAQHDPKSQSWIIRLVDTPEGV